MLNSDHLIDRYIATRFAEQGVRFFHAENIEGFRAHCENGRLLCRQGLVQAIPDAYTHFESDDYDQANGFDARVFGNIYDLGAIYARTKLESEKPAAPNIYGPILFVFRPDVFGAMRDIVITKQSAWKTRPRWRELGVAMEAVVEELLRPDWVKDNVADAWQHAELSCANTELPLSYLEKIIVEPLSLPGAPPDRFDLPEVVTVIARRCRIAVPIEVRDYTDRRQHFKPANLEALRSLASFCEQVPLTVTQQNWKTASHVLPQDLQNLHASTRGKMLRFAQYYTFGTVRATRR